MDSTPGSEEQGSPAPHPLLRPSSYEGPYNHPPGGRRGDRGGGGRGHGDRPFNPYRDPYIDPVIPLEDLPSWDGADDTAIHYIMRVREHASMGGYIREQLAHQLWRRFKKDSDIYNWYMALSPEDKAYMKSDYTCFLSFIWDMWLGNRWRQSQRQKYYKLSFREEGHSTEAPDAFIRRRLILGRMLSILPTDIDGNVDPHDEVLEVIYALPLSWRTKLSHLNIPNPTVLQQEVRSMSEVLLYEYERAKNPPITMDELIPILRGLGVEIPDQPAGGPGPEEREEEHRTD